jgi:hypothetical protein
MGWRRWPLLVGLPVLGWSSIALLASSRHRHDNWQGTGSRPSTGRDVDEAIGVTDPEATSPALYRAASGAAVGATVRRR